MKGAEEVVGCGVGNFDGVEEVKEEQFVYVDVDTACVEYIEVAHVVSPMTRDVLNGKDMNSPYRIVAVAVVVPTRRRIFTMPSAVQICKPWRRVFSAELFSCWVQLSV